MIYSVDNDGVMQGYDLSLYQSISSCIYVPHILCGGASGIEDIKTLFDEVGGGECCRGSMFVYHGKHKKQY